jgi:nitrile hydratase subunit beta
VDGIHDLGGMHGFGRVEREENEPPFHAAWEAAVLAIMRSTSGGRVYNIDEFRHAIERMEPPRYLNSSYYERWLDGVTRVLIDKGVITPEEIEARASFLADHPEAAARPAATGSRPTTRPLLSTAETFFRPGSAPPRFAPGDLVITRTARPRGHTRLPRYARGKRGAIDRLHGVCVLPDANAHGLGEQPEPVYSVRFDARELWGESAEPNQDVLIDLWESYLLPAAAAGVLRHSAAGPP